MCAGKTHQKCYALFTRALREFHFNSAEINHRIIIVYKKRGNCSEVEIVYFIDLDDYFSAHNAQLTWNRRLHVRVLNS